MTSITKVVTFKRDEGSDDSFEVNFEDEYGFQLSLDYADDYYGYTYVPRLTRENLETVREAIDQILREAPDE